MIASEGTLVDGIERKGQVGKMLFGNPVTIFILPDIRIRRGMGHR
jgi:hypothetical protein